MTDDSTAVCISKRDEGWNIPTVPFYCHTEGWKPFGHERSKERILYLAERRNKAVSRALELFPETKHILMVDSYYLNQQEKIRKLILEYQQLGKSQTGDCIIGASTWIYDKTRITPRKRFFDVWTTPEGSQIRPEDAQAKGERIKVNSVGGCYLYPRYVWEKIGYAVPNDLHGCEHNWLCENSGLPVWLSLNVMLWREPIIYFWPKRVRMSAHLGRFKLS